MITRPTTVRILADVITELEREILPLLPESVDQIRLQMIMTVLGHCAVRAGHETAWMTEEAVEYVDYARAVLDATKAVDVRDALSAVTPFADLRLAAVSANYSRASEALSLALDAAMDAGNDDLVAQGEQLLRMRVANEQAVTGASEYAGR